jgi:hypothetical protein
MLLLSVLLLLLFRIQSKRGDNTKSKKKKKVEKLKVKQSSLSLSVSVSLLVAAADVGSSAKEGDAFASPSHDGRRVVCVSVQLNATPLGGDKAFRVGRDGRAVVGGLADQFELRQFSDGFRLAHPLEKDVQAVLEAGNFHHDFEAVVFAHRLAKLSAFVVLFPLSEHGVVRLVNVRQDLGEQGRHVLAKQQDRFSQAVVEKFENVISGFFVDAGSNVSVFQIEFHLRRAPRPFFLGAGGKGRGVVAENPHLGRFLFPFFVVGKEDLGGLLAVIPFMAFGGGLSGLFGGRGGNDQRFVFSFGARAAGLGVVGRSGVLRSQKIFSLSLFTGFVVVVLVVVEGVVDVGWRQRSSKLRHGKR